MTQSAYAPRDILLGLLFALSTPAQRPRTSSSRRIMGVKFGGETSIVDLELAAGQTR